MIRLGPLVVALAAMASLNACGQGVGDRCQVDSDCKNGLLCALPPGDTREEGGTCQSNEGTDMAVIVDFAGVDQTVPAVDLDEVD